MADYGPLSRLLHSLALGVPAIAEASFDVEQSSLGELPATEGGQHVFVCGLARSGTTVLMRSLFASGAFCSLTYRDMPFVLAPTLWSRIAGRSRTQRAATERAHGDGVMVDFDSPEALEEVFWRIFCGAGYIKSDRLVPMQADAQSIQRFRGYLASILRRYAATRYLSKNNNNILRLDSLLAACPRSRILVPFRDPLRQSASLREQHLRFSAERGFTTRYMRWLAHHEFGADHRPFDWGVAPSRGYARTELNYWLAQWVGVYEYLLQEVPRLAGRARLLSYESLCTHTVREWSRVCEFVELDALAPADLKVKNPQIATAGIDGALRTRALELHAQLLAVAS